jgi:hypothetical protein
MTDIYRELITKDNSYPEPDDPDIQLKIFKKREYYYHKIPERINLEKYEDIKEYRDSICSKMRGLQPHQAMVSNFINPDTPYKGLLLFHGVGTGKCVHKDSEIELLNQKNRKICELWENQKEIITDTDGGEWIEPTNPIYVKSLNEKNKLIKCKVKRVYREKLNNTMRIIYLKNRSKICMTYHHQLYVITEVNLNTFGFTSIENGNVFPFSTEDTRINEGQQNQIKSGLWTNCIYKHDYVGISTKDGSSYSEVIEIEEMEYNDYVYDLEIERYHNYVANEIICHNTCAALAVAEKFKDLVKKYNTKIHILVPGPLLKESWKKHLIICTGDTYKQNKDITDYKVRKDARQDKTEIQQASQYYTIMSNRSFYRKVLGEKIIEKKENSNNNKKGVSYKKNEDGEFERDISNDQIYNLNNTLLIVDEAHGYTGNEYGEALKYIIKKSVNLKILLLSATPMKNLGDDIVELINYLRPSNSQIIRDKIFTSDKGYKMKIKQGGMEYLKNMTRGYISHIRGADPISYAKKNTMGITPKGLKFITITPCKMEKFQETTYKEVIEKYQDALDRYSEAVSNFVFPGLSDDNTKLIGLYGNEGLQKFINQIKTENAKINQLIATHIIKDENEIDLVYLSEDKRNITGNILHEKYLKYFSIKFYTALVNINKLVWGESGAKIGFVYSNLVKVGIELFQEILLFNGYLEYNENSNSYNIRKNTRCYYCGITNNNHTPENIKHIPEHTYGPATFITITGSSNDDSVEILPEEKQHIFDNVFNNINNKEGKYIKFILGTKVMNEGISLKNISEIHILDVYYNLGRVDQVIGRGIRYCSHYGVMTKENPYPEVKVYKYATVFENELSSEIILYQKAEIKYVLIKKIERYLKEVAIDCPLNINANMFAEEIEKYKDCKKDNSCPVECDYTDCHYRCDNSKLNAKYYDPKRKLYRNLPNNEIDMSTFTHKLALTEISFVKETIKQMFIYKYVYEIKEIIKYVYDNTPKDKLELFDNYFVYKALDNLIPTNENDFNNYKDIIRDKYNRQGYLIYIKKYYIFQPFDQHEYIPMYYRTTYDKSIKSGLTLNNYLKNSKQYIKIQKEIDKTSTHKSEDKHETPSSYTYDFSSIMDYYDNRDEFKFIGIIDKETSHRKRKMASELTDVFKIREKRQKILSKKRGTGIPSLKGSVCATSKDKTYLYNIAKLLKMDMEMIKGLKTRGEICEELKKRMLKLEKYSTGENKKTYVMIPANHPEYEFPYNLEDRYIYIINKINKVIKINIKIIQTTDGIVIDDFGEIEEYIKFISSLGGVKKKNKWIIKIEK